ncbi:MAG: gliding motility-associated C-terminal domain-containing protein [Bacteroidia bacterium]
MKKFKDITDFENVLKDTLQDHSTSAPTDVWSVVSASTSQSVSLISQVGNFVGSATNLLKVALFAGGLVAIGVVIYTENKPEPREEVVASVQQNSEENEIEAFVENEPEEQIAHTDRKEEIKTTVNNKLREPNTNPARKADAIQQSTEITVSNDGSSRGVIGTADNDGPKSASTKDNEENKKPHTFLVSDGSPCVGDIITLSQDEETDWYVNGVCVAKGVKEHTLPITAADVLTVSNGYNSKAINVSELQGTISSEEIARGKYLLKLEEGLIANWHMDDKLIATNLNALPLTIMEVGQHKVEAKVINHTCNATFTLPITLSAVGSVNFYKIFTPNGDGKNDTYAVDIIGYENFSIQIFTLQNERVFVSQNPDYKWNGTKNNEGAKCEEGEYIAKISYQLNGEAPQVKNVRLMLKRL